MCAPELFGGLVGVVLHAPIFSVYKSPAVQKHSDTGIAAAGGAFDGAFSVSGAPWLSPRGRAVAQYNSGAGLGKLSLRS